MAGDSTSKNDDELLSQIDELKARMDRLMRGGTSTSNSALLTDTAKPKQPEVPAVAPTASNASPERPRVRDLIDTEDTEVVEVYPGPKEVVPFPEDEADKQGPTPAPAAPPAEPPIRATRDRATPVGGSVVPVEKKARNVRPSVSSFDDLGSAIQEELARDTSVPPVGAKKGPDLASRFGPAEGRDAAEVVPPTVDPESEEESATAAEAADEETDTMAQPEEEYVVDDDEVLEGSTKAGAVVAIWVLVAIASSAIATLHFTGLI